jgi:hypothetical protein
MAKHPRNLAVYESTVSVQPPTDWFVKLGAAQFLHRVLDILLIASSIFDPALGREIPFAIPAYRDRFCREGLAYCCQMSCHSFSVRQRQSRPAVGTNG